MRRIKKTSIVLIMLLVLVICLAACSGKDESGLPHMEVDVLQGEDGASYTKMNGSEQRSFQVEEGENYDIEINVKKEEGKLNLYIAKDGKKENTIYEGNDISSFQFTVHAEGAGDYIICIEAYDFVGDYTCEISKVQ